MVSIVLDFSEKEYNKLKSKVNGDSYKYTKRFNIKKFIKEKCLE